MPTVTNSKFTRSSSSYKDYQYHGIFLGKALIILAVGLGIALPLFGMGTNIYLPFTVLASTLIISLFYYPLVGVILAFVLSGTSQLTVVIPDALSISKLVMMFTVIIYFMKSSLTKDLRKALKSKVLLCYALPGIWFLCTIPFTTLLGGADPDQIASRIFNIISILLLAFLISAIPKNIQEVNTTILGMVLGSAVVGVWIIFFQAGGATEKLYAAIDNVTIFYDHNLGIQLGLSVLLSSILLIQPFWFIKTLVLISNVLLLICIFLTHSRTAYASIIVGVLIILLRILFKNKIISIFKCVFIISVLGLVLMWFINSDFLPQQVKLLSFMRFESMFKPKANTSYDERLDALWPNSWSFVLNNPVLGSGIAGGTKYGIAHNAVLEMGVEGGLIGICFYFISLFFMLQATCRASDPDLQMWGLAITGFVIMASQTNPGTFYSIPYAFVIGFTAWIELHISSTSRSLRPFQGASA